MLGEKRRKEVFMGNKMLEVKEEIKKAVKGKDEVIEKVLAAMLAGGHILLEDIPGVGGSCY